MFSEMVIYKSGSEIKEAAKARLNADLLEPELTEYMIMQLKVLSRNPKDEDKFPLTVNQLILLRL